MSVCINIRNAPESLLDFRYGKNHLNYERVSFPMSTDFNAALQRNSSQMNDYKTSNRNYQLYYFMKIVFTTKHIMDSQMRRTISIMQLASYFIEFMRYFCVWVVVYA